MKNISLSGIIAVIAGLVVITGIILFSLMPEEDKMASDAAEMMADGEEMIAEGSDMLRSGEEMLADLDQFFDENDTASVDVERNEVTSNNPREGGFPDGQPDLEF